MIFKNWLKLEDEQKVQFDIEQMNDIVLEFIDENKDKDDCLDSNERTSLYLLVIRLITSATMESPDKSDKKIYIHTLSSILSQPLSLPCSENTLDCSKYYDRCVGALEVLEANIESFKVLFEELKSDIYMPEQKIIVQ